MKITGTSSRSYSTVALSKTDAKGMMGHQTASNAADLHSSRPAGRESSSVGNPVKRIKKKTDPKANNTQDPSKNSTALELLRIILETDASQDDHPRKARIIT
jgi:hypothetical protein